MNGGFWDKDDPLHREIMQVNKEAFIERHAIELQAKIDSIVASLPWWARVYIRAIGLWQHLRGRA